MSSDNARKWLQMHLRRVHSQGSGLKAWILAAPGVVRSGCLKQGPWLAAGLMHWDSSSRSWPHVHSQGWWEVSGYHQGCLAQVAGAFALNVLSEPPPSCYCPILQAWGSPCFFLEQVKEIACICTYSIETNTFPAPPDSGLLNQLG